MSSTDPKATPQRIPFERGIYVRGGGDRPAQARALHRRLTAKARRLAKATPNELRRPSDRKLVECPHCGVSLTVTVDGGAAPKGNAA